MLQTMSASRPQTSRSRRGRRLRRLHRGRPLLAFAALAVVGSATCRSTGDRPVVDLRWSSLVSARTQGTVSKREQVTVRFAYAVADEDMVGQLATGALLLDPEVDGAATFTSTRELVFTPAAHLPSGETFQAIVRSEGLLGLPDEIGDYRFSFDVIEQGFDVDVHGLDLADDAAGAALSGSIATADYAEPDAVKGTLRAIHDGEELEIRWRHDIGARNHRFTVPGLVRGEQDGVVTVRWNGRAVGVAARGTEDVTIPGTNVFRVTDVRTESEDRQYALIRFSDPLDPAQNLNGLVGLGGERFTLEVDGNVLRVIPASRIVGPATVVVEEGVRSSPGGRIAERTETEVTFVDVKPGVRFAGRGVVLPEADRLTVPIEAVNVHSVQVTALRVFDNNIGQFLQDNRLSGAASLRRTGSTLWQRTIDLGDPPPGGQPGWTRHTLDVSDLLRSHRGSLIRLTLAIDRGNSTFACWDRGVDEGSLRWRDRNDPCTDSYYSYGSRRTSDSRNFLASNIGLTAKRDPRGGVLVATTNLRTSEPTPGVSVTFMDYVNQPLATVVTGEAGLARTTFDGTPHYAVASLGDDRGYLRMDRGSALPTSHFDVGGEVVEEGLKGAIYGERGVWRPGDDIHLTFVLDDVDNPLPDNHPATLRLLDPAGSVAQSVTNSDPVGDFYAFALNTPVDAPTGNWNAAVEVGGARFTAPVRIETVMPNRLRVDLDLGGDDLLQRGAEQGATVFGQWLTGAVARDLKADVEVGFRSAPTVFSDFPGYAFDDPARDYAGDPVRIFDGSLDDEGLAGFTARLAPDAPSSGMLAATFVTRVFEPGGAFSTNRKRVRFSPYERYVGIRPPAGDRRGTLVTDSTHAVEVVTVSPDGNPVAADSIDLVLYKIDWRWWWDRSAESLARFAESEHSSAVAHGRIATAEGRGSWDFSVGRAAWGRYLLRACDAEGGHCTGATFHVDWPGWAGRPRDDSDAGASALALFADTTHYTVGDTAQVRLPEANTGRALVTIETGSRILEERWVELEGERVQFDVPITAEMSPNVYVGVSLLQPHSGRGNDRPIRLYGFVPLEVEDPATVLRPEIGVPEEWRPSAAAAVRVSEASGRPMTYTLAVVDEGLLGLTGFETPDLHDRFHRREALGVSTWDIFDEVAGAYGGELERILALGGDGAATIEEQDRNRFPPVVRFLGPFQLEPGQLREHTVDIPEYVGQVRVTVVAGQDGAYGSASESVFVRQPLSLLATVPRVVGPGEEIVVPVAVFAMEDGIEEARVTVAGERFEVLGSAADTVRFDGGGERLATLRVRAGQRPGQGVLRFAATAGEHAAGSEVALRIRNPNPATTTVLRARLAPGESWGADLEPHGIPGTNEATLEVTPLPPIDLGRRLDYLVRYPHGCVEQVTSAVFAQLYLPLLAPLGSEGLARVESNVQAGIDKLRGFQNSSGGFSYWPGFPPTGGGRDAWATSYVGHFLVEAERLGYDVDPQVISRWRAHQGRQARAWTARGGTPAMDQAYRLYSLALAGDHQIAAMNRLRQTGDLVGAGRWHLAAAYRAAGVDDAAARLVRADEAVSDYTLPGWSMGSALRDRAILLEALTTLDRPAQSAVVAQQISGALHADAWHSTHAIAYALLAMARFYGLNESAADFAFERRVGGDARAISSVSPIHTEGLGEFADRGGRLDVANNSDRDLFVSVVRRGSPPSGQETGASSGIEVVTDYSDLDGGPIDVAELVHGTDLVADVTVTNSSGRDARDLALAYVAPAGWEIHNARMEGIGGRVDRRIEHQDVRDDRVLTYFSLDHGESLTVSMRFNAAYLGDYYLPTTTVEAMYDASLHGRVKGMPVRVVESGEGR